MKKILSAICLGVLVISFTPAGNKDFNSEKHQWLVELIPKKQREDIVKVLEDAGGNWTELAGAIKAVKGKKRELVLWLVKGMPHLDTVEISKEIILEHINYSLRVKDRFDYDMSEEFFKSHILAYRMHREPVTAWRKKFFDFFGDRGGELKDARKAARNINVWIDEHIEKIDGDVLGAQQSPLSTLRSRKGTKKEISVLTTAALKAIGIPSRNVFIKWLGSRQGGISWMEFYYEGQWHPLYPLKSDHFGDLEFIEKEHPKDVTLAVAQSAFEREFVSERYSETGKLNVHITQDGEPASEFKHFSVCVFNKGSFKPLDNIGARTDKSGDFQAELGEGTYYLIAGDRNENGDVGVTTRTFGISPDEKTKIDLKVRKMKKAKKEKSVFPKELLNTGLEVFPEGKLKLKGDFILLAYRCDHEPSLRMLSSVKEITGDMDVNFYLLPAENCSEQSLKKLAGRTEGEIFKQKDKLGETLKINTYPVCFAVNEKGKTLLKRTGYNTSIGEIIKDLDF